MDSLFSELSAAYEPKERPLRYVLRAIEEIFAGKAAADAAADVRSLPRVPLPVLTYQLHQTKFGVRDLAEMRLVDLLHSLRIHSNVPRVRTFARLLRLYDPLPPEAADVYVDCLALLHREGGLIPRPPRPPSPAPVPRPASGSPTRERPAPPDLWDVPDGTPDGFWVREDAARAALDQLFPGAPPDPSLLEAILVNAPYPPSSSSSPTSPAPGPPEPLSYASRRPPSRRTESPPRGARPPPAAAPAPSSSSPASSAERVADLDALLALAVDEFAVQLAATLELVRDAYHRHALGKGGRPPSAGSLLAAAREFAPWAGPEEGAWLAREAARGGAGAGAGAGLSEARCGELVLRLLLSQRGSDRFGVRGRARAAVERRLAAVAPPAPV
eukprot:tig00020902_g15058.t1